jgi:hypothetical protein
MLVPLPQAFAVDRGSIRGPTSGRRDFATAPSRSDDPGRSSFLASSSAAEVAGTRSSGASSEISPTLAGASEYDDCPDDPDDAASIADLNATARELDRRCTFKENDSATDTADEDHRVLDCSNDATCPVGKVCADTSCLWPAP